MEAIIVENLVKKYGDFEAVKGISFKVKQGEIFAFLGPNGAGKTTTVHVLTTLLKPTSGRAIVAGHDVVKEPMEVRKKIGIVFQDPSVDRELTAWENMYIHGRIYGLRGQDLKKKIEELLKFVELWEFRDKQVKYFSGGMQRRLEIARSLLHEPEVLFLDEPTIGLDPQTRAHIWEYIKTMKEEHDMTIFLTTHYMDEAEQLADRIAIIDHGKIIAKGTTEELKKLVGNDIIYVKFEKPTCVQAEFIRGCKILNDGRVALEVNNAAEVLPLVFEKARDMGLKILEVTYHRPTLNDVFLHLTGREIRDEASDRSTMPMRRWGR
ncbi:DrrA-related ABC transporter ATP-binding protein [Pyrococcus furiosus DSM 3638]|uniref:DrrA-related ABC transporter ATP-binding protein n=3 Tax=Pyrococcus furiosus TaxID=2261 RepID=A0A5C0XNF8_PYRFU|nr:MULTISPECIES: ATP-binding cassette domain-containing protein [Pyrococcus]AAL80707.1 daunorubicin resistance ATP-binding protein [Pyrococcus furiosus DSM 3638]AFN03376.1 daunorubicin resistance ATP-binding protein [Pyrococcus furiosus COM1]MDK2870327.1 type transport system ATP-binding protein [Pyrococcus sp.]QEK78289.1 DrrA-related ABC transporter ATP-binding protein [Pyrococcus furiosus DSM 3638]